jgi:hypothetical protein
MADEIASMPVVGKYTLLNSWKRPAKISVNAVIISPIPGTPHHLLSV